MKNTFTYCHNKTVKSILAFCVVLLMSVCAFGQVTATEDFENESTPNNTTPHTFSESGISFSSTTLYQKIPTPTFGYNNSTSYIVIANATNGVGLSKSITINNASTSFKINSFAAYVGSNTTGSTATNGSITFVGTLVGGGTATATVNVASTGAVPSGQTRESNLMVNGLNFTSTPLDGVYITSLAIQTSASVQFVQLDHINFTTQAVVTNQYSINSVSQNEGNSGTSNFTFTITRTNNSAAGSVNVQSADGTATAGSDYTAFSTTVNFTAGGPLTQTVNVVVNGDVAVEPDETFTMTLSTPVGGVLLTSTGTGTIVDDDAVNEPFDDETDLSTAFTQSSNNFQTTGRLKVRNSGNLGAGGTSGYAFSAEPFAVGNQGSFQITSPGKSFNVISVDLWSAAVSGSAPNWSFTATNCTITFTGTKADGTGTVTHTAAITPSGTNVHSTVNFAGSPLANVQLSAISFSTPAGVQYLQIDNFRYGTATLSNTQLSIDDVSIIEGTGTGSKSAVFTVTRTNNTTAFSVNVASSDGTATAGTDYTAVNTTLNFAIGGALTQTVTVPIIKDATAESNENFNLTLSGATSGTLLLKQTGVGTILNDDGTIVETFEDETHIATTFSESGGSFSATGGYQVIKLAGNGSGSSGAYLASNNNVVGSMGTFTLTTPGAVFKLVSLDAWVALSGPATGSGPVTFTGTLYGGGTVSATKTITSTALDGTGWQQNITFTGTALDNVLLTAVQVSTGGSLRYAYIDNLNYLLVEPVPNIEVVDASNNAITNGGVAGTANNTDFGLKCLTGATQSKTYTIKNTGFTDLTLSGSPLAVLGGTDANQFSITTQPSSTIAPGASTTFTVLFDPNTGGAKNATITLTSNDATNTPYVINIKGIGGAEPTVTLSPIPAICAGATSFTIPFTNPTANPTAYSVSGTGITTVINRTPPNSPMVVTLSSPAVFGTNPSFTFSLINGNGCVSPNYTGSVTVNAAPVPNPTSNSPICVGSTLNLSSDASTSYSWSGPNSFTSTLQNPSISNVAVVAGGIYTITQTNSFNCTATATTSVTVSPFPTINTSASPAICEGATTFTIPYSGTTGTPTTYSISGTGIITVTDAVLPATPITVNLSSPASGSLYSYTLTVKNAIGCISSNVTGSVSVNPLPTIAVGIIQPICAGATSFTIPYTGTTGTPTTYSISGTGITTVTDATLPATSIPVSLSSGATGTSISFTLTVKNAGGCTSTNVVGSVPVNPLPTITTSASPAICAGATSFTIPYTATTETPTTYSISGTGITTVTDATLPATPITVNLSIGASGSSISYTLTVKNANGCTSSNVNGSVTVNPLPTITTGASPAICEGATTFTIPYTATTASPTLYSISGAGITTVTDATLSASPITVNLDGGASGSSISYILIVRNANGCLSNNVSGSVTVNSTPAPTNPIATPSSRTTTGSSTLTASGCSGGTLTWYDAATNIAVPSPNNQPNFTSSGTYNFYAKCTGSNTCVSPASTNVSVSVVLCTPLASSPGNVNITWTGLESTDWNTACNWSPAWVPDLTNGKVIIPNTTNKPIVSAAIPDISSIEVQNSALLTINSGGIMNVRGDGGVSKGFTIVGGRVTNNGTINVESATNTAIPAYIYLQATDAVLTNNGTIKINSTDEAIGVGIATTPATITNSSTGVINIVNGIGLEIALPADALNFNNAGIINYNGSVLTFKFLSPTPGGGTTFTNTGTVNINSGTGIENPTRNTINNNACGKILMSSGNYTNGGTTTNAGLIQLPNTYNFTNTGTFTNNGVLKANTVSGITNNKMVITNACPIFTLGGSNNYTVSGIFTDAGATTSAGTYTSVGNKFTANNTLPSGSQTLYAQVTGGACTYVVPFDFNNEKPTAVSVNKTIICPAGSVSLSGTCTSGTLTWYTTATGGSSIGTGTNLSHSPTVTTTYYASCETTNCSSGRVATDAVTISALPTASANSNSPVCQGNTLNLTGGATGNTYAWSGPNSFNSTEQSPSIASVTSSAQGAYTITVTNGNGCTATATTSVIVNALPTATATSNSPVCAGNTLNLLGGGLSTPAFAPTGSYAWSGPNSFSSTLQNPSIASATTLATGTYQLIITNENGCTAMATTSVTVNALPTATATSNSPVCVGSALNLSANGGVSYSWTGVNSFTSSLQNPSISPVTSSANGTYRVVVTNAAGCTAAATTSVVVNALPTATATSNSPICAGNTLNLLGGGLSVPNLVPTGSYAWSGPNSFSSTLQNPSITSATTLATGTYQLIITNENGCTAVATTSVIVNALPTATATSNSPVCIGSTLNLSATGGVSYSWTGVNSFYSAQQNPSITAVTSSANGTYQVVVTNAAGCTAMATTSVIINALPTATATSNSPVCAGSALNLSATGGVSYSWTGVNSFTSSLQNPSISSVTSSANGTYRVVVTNAEGCTAAATTSVIVNALPTATATSNSPVCAGNTLNLLGGGLSTPAFAPTGSYAWSGPNSFSSALQNPSITSATTLATGTYQLIITNENGCTAMATTSVTVNALPTATATSNSPVCVGSTLNLSASGGVSYSWTGVNSFTSSLQNPSISPVTSSANGTYRVVVTNAAGCTAAATTSVIVNALPTATATSNSPICAGNTLNLLGGGLSVPQLAPTGSYAWSGPNSFSSTLQNPSITSATTLATGTYQLIITNENGCTAMATTSVIVNALPTATATSNSPVCSGTTVNLMGGGLSIPSLAPTGSYAWSGPNSFSSTLQNPSITSATTLATGTYQLIITNENGCTAMATTSVIVNALPTATATSNSPICSGASLNLSATGGTSYAWTGVNSFTSSLQNPSILSATTAATGTYQVIVTDGNGCTAMATTSATVNPTPVTPTTQANTQIIFGGNVTLTATGCSGSNDVLKWYQATDNALVTMPVAPTITTNYYAKCETTSNGITCISEKSSDVTVTVLSPTPPVATGGTTCIGSPLTLTATGCSGSTGTFVLKWYQNSDNTLVTMPVSPSVTTQYYAKCEQTFNSVTAVSEKSNVVTLTVLNPSVPVATGATIYNGNSTALTATGCTGEGFVVKWYETLSNTLVTMPVSPTVTTQYYAKCEQTANSVTCISAKSNDVTLTVVNRIFVDVSKVAAPVQNGASWATAYGNLQTGLAAATAAVEVWVAKGTYKTTSSLDRTISFNIPNDVIVYGGFAGTENALSERNVKTNVSILSGEIGNQGSITDNSYHVVVFNGSSNKTVLDGFTITGGNASFNPNKSVSLPLVAPLSTPAIESGGGIVLINGAMPMIANATINSNSAVFGGGIFAIDASKPTITFCKFMGNQATFGAGIYLQDGSHATISNTLISGNRGVGGLYNNYSSPIITNTTFSGNGGYNGGIFNSNSQPVVKNSIIWGNSTPFNDTQSIISYSIIQGGYPGTGNLNYDPQFVNPAPEGLSPNLSGDYHLKANSLGIDRGDNGTISTTDLDLDGNLRRFNGGRVDVGAYEFQGNATATLVISINSGNWESNSTWDIGRVPQIGDVVIIDKNHIVTLNGQGNAKNIEYRGTGQLKFNSANAKINIGF